jgi:hypothetical protein
LAKYTQHNSGTQATMCIRYSVCIDSHCYSKSCHCQSLTPDYNQFMYDLAGTSFSTPLLFAHGVLFSELFGVTESKDKLQYYDCLCQINVAGMYPLCSLCTSLLFKDINKSVWFLQPVAIATIT